MILLLDQGNSRLKWLSVSGEGRILRRGVIVTDQPLQESMADIGRSMGRTPDSAHASVVAGGERAAALVESVRKSFGIPLSLAVTAGDFRGLRNGYFEASRLGVDRWLAMIGARVVRQEPMLVVDAGTAMTVDAIGSDGLHLGGYIVPGYKVQCEALGRSTAGVSTIVSPAGGNAWGRSTAEAVTSGVRHGLAALINEALVELQAHVADTCGVMLTGGDAQLLAGALSCPATVDEDLLFRGLWATISPMGVGLR